MNQEPEISRITEAFSMQPDSKTVGDTYMAWPQQDKVIIAKIVPEDVYVTGDPYQKRGLLT